MGFNSEAEMKEVAREALSDGFTSGPTIMMDEFAYANGKADLVLARASESYLNHRTNVLDISTPMKKDSYLQVFLQLHNHGPVTREHFYSVGATSKRTKDEALDWLFNYGFATETDDGKIQTAPYLRRHVTTSYSIELKLENWKKALEQAVRGKSFADYQYVVLDESNILRAINHMGEFEDYGVGLMEIDETGEYHIHYKPDKESPYSPMNKWRLNEKTIREGVSQSIIAEQNVIRSETGAD